jgi:hypothetical protein
MSTPQTLALLHSAFYRFTVLVDPIHSPTVPAARRRLGR